MEKPGVPKLDVDVLINGTQINIAPDINLSARSVSVLMKYLVHPKLIKSTIFRQNERELPRRVKIIYERRRLPLVVTVLGLNPSLFHPENPSKEGTPIRFLCHMKKQTRSNRINKRMTSNRRSIVWKRVEWKVRSASLALKRREDANRNYPSKHDVGVVLKFLLHALRNNIYCCFDMFDKIEKRKQKTSIGCVSKRKVFSLNEQR